MGVGQATARERSNIRVGRAVSSLCPLSPLIGNLLGGQYAGIDSEVVNRTFERPAYCYQELAANVRRDAGKVERSHGDQLLGSIDVGHGGAAIVRDDNLVPHPGLCGAVRREALAAVIARLRLDVVRRLSQLPPPIPKQ